MLEISVYTSLKLTYPPIPKATGHNSTKIMTIIDISRLSSSVTFIYFIFKRYFSGPFRTLIEDFSAMMLVYHVPKKILQKAVMRILSLHHYFGSRKLKWFAGLVSWDLMSLVSRLPQMLLSEYTWRGTISYVHYTPRHSVWAHICKTWNVVQTFSGHKIDFSMPNGDKVHLQHNFNPT